MVALEVAGTRGQPFTALETAKPVKIKKSDFF